MLYVICGLPGTGKTRTAKELARLTCGVVLRTDVIRKQLFSDPEYTPEEKEKVYDAMFRTALTVLKAGTDVILDGTFHREKERHAARELAGKAGTGFRLIEVRCGEDKVKRNMERRKARDDESDADYAVYRRVKEEWEPPKGKSGVVSWDGGNPGKELERIVKEAGRG